MKLTSIVKLLMLVALASCTSAAEKQALYEVAEFYGGNVQFSRGSNSSTSSDEPQGHYLAIELNSPGLSRHYPTLQLPASNCAYLVYNNFTPSEREDYDYLQVTLQDSGSTHTYTFNRQQLQLAFQAATNLRTLIFNIQSGEYSAVASSFHPASLGTLPRDSVRGIMRSIGKRLNPFTEYRIHGFDFTDFSNKGKKQQLVRLFVSVPRPPQPDHFLLAAINPNLSDTQQFLYGLNLTQ